MRKNQGQGQRGPTVTAQQRDQQAESVERAIEAVFVGDGLTAEEEAIRDADESYEANRHLFLKGQPQKQAC